MTKKAQTNNRQGKGKKQVPRAATEDQGKWEGKEGKTSRVF